MAYRTAAMTMLHSNTYFCIKVHQEVNKDSQNRRWPTHGQAQSSHARIIVRGPAAAPSPRRSSVRGFWRPRPELNRRTRFCRPLRNHSATWPPYRVALTATVTLRLYRRRREAATAERVARGCCGDGDNAAPVHRKRGRGARSLRFAPPCRREGRTRFGGPRVPGARPVLIPNAGRDATGAGGGVDGFRGRAAEDGRR